MFQKSLLPILASVVICISRAQSPIEPESTKLLKISKCYSSSIEEDTIALPQNLLKQKTRNTTDEIIVGLITNKLHVLDCLETLNLEIKVGHGENTSQPKLLFLSNGYAIYDQTNFLPPEDFCLESKSASTLKFKICLPSKICSPQSPCIRKCCDMDQVLDLSQFSSQGKLVCKGASNNATMWSPQLYKDAYTKTNNVVKMNFISRNPKYFCTGDATLLSLRPFASQDVSPFRILEDGSVIEKIGRSAWVPVPGDATCVDGAQNFPFSDYDNSLTSGQFSGDEKATVLIDCRSFMFEGRNEQHEKFTAIYVIALLIAIFFLVLTLVAHIVLWRRQTLRGWALMGYVTFLALEFAFLILARVTTVSGVVCTMAAIGTHFTALATFSWLTTSMFDVWWNFRTMNPCTTKKDQLKMFMLYATFATTIPICIVTLGLILQHIYGSDQFSEVIVPEYGKLRCGLGTSAEFPYLFGPISFLLGSNLVFLVITLYYVFKHQKVLRLNGIKTKILNDKLRFFGMLFLVAGVTWIFDVISWATTPTNSETPWYWMAFDFVNIFQAIAIFLIFVCNKTTMHHLQKEFPALSSFKLWSTPDDTKNVMHENPNNGNRADRKLSITQVFSITENLRIFKKI